MVARALAICARRLFCSGSPSNSARLTSRTFANSSMCTGFGRVRFSSHPQTAASLTFINFASCLCDMAFDSRIRCTRTPKLSRCRAVPATADPCATAPCRRAAPKDIRDIGIAKSKPAKRPLTQATWDLAAPLCGSLTSTGFPTVMGASPSKTSPNSEILWIMTSNSPCFAFAPGKRIRVSQGSSGSPGHISIKAVTVIIALSNAASLRRSPVRLFWLIPKGLSPSKCGHIRDAL